MTVHIGPDGRRVVVPANLSRGDVKRLRNAARRRKPPQPCPWCGVPLGERPDPGRHARLNAESETSWRRRAT